MQKLLILLRQVYALFYAAVGAHGLLVMVGWVPTPDYGLSVEEAAFQHALAATDFMFPIIWLAFVAAGILMLFHRTAPLGIVLLAPFVVVILFNHLMLNGDPIWGVMHALLLIVFAWQFRSAYFPLWNYARDGQSKR